MHIGFLKMNLLHSLLISYLMWELQEEVCKLEIKIDLFDIGLNLKAMNYNFQKEKPKVING